MYKIEYIDLTENVIQNNNCVILKNDPTYKFQKQARNTISECKK
jgi:hypothetical protein